MAQTLTTERLAFITLDGDGQICPVFYQISESQEQDKYGGKNLIKIVRELHKDEKVDDWTFYLFSSGELCSWAHTNSPVYMECKNFEKGDEISLDEESDSELTLQNKVVSSNLPSKPSLSSLMEKTPKHLSTIDEDENEDLMSVSQNNPDNQQQTTGPQIQQTNAAENTSGSTMHLKNLFGEELPEVTISNEETIVREQTFNSESTMHIRGMFEEAYRKDSEVGLQREKSNSSGSTMHLRGLFEEEKHSLPDNLTEEFPLQKEIVLQSGSMHLGALFEEGKSSLPDNSTEEIPLQKEGTFQSGSTMHLRGLFDANENEGKTSDKVAVDEICNNMGNFSTERENATDRTINSSSSSFHLKGLFASYKSELNFRQDMQNDDKTITRESTMNIGGLLDSATDFSKTTAETSEGKIDTDFEKVAPTENEKDDCDKVLELGDENGVVEKFVQQNFFSNTDDNLSETDNPTMPMPSLLSYLPRHVLLDSLYHHKPSPIPEEEEEQLVDQESSPGVELENELLDSIEPEKVESDEIDNSLDPETNAKTLPEYEAVQNVEETEASVEPMVSADNENITDNENNFPIEMFDNERSTGVLSRDNSLPYELEPQNFNSPRGKNGGIFPPLPASPRGDKKMTKLMSRRLSALMTGLDNSIGDEPSGDKENVPASDKKKKTQGRGGARSNKNTWDSPRTVNTDDSDKAKINFADNTTDKETIDNTKQAKENSSPEWQRKLEFQSDYNTFNRFMVLSRESTQIGVTPRQDDSTNEVKEIVTAAETETDILEKGDKGFESGVEKVVEKLEKLNLRKSYDSPDVFEYAGNVNVGGDLQTQSPDDGMGSSDASARLSENYQHFSFNNINDTQKIFKSECENYVENHPEIRKILGDFLQTLLIAKPDEILPFASAYFQFISNVKKN